jgi:hypothetical protein
MLKDSPAFSIAAEGRLKRVWVPVLMETGIQTISECCKDGYDVLFPGI